MEKIELLKIIYSIFNLKRFKINNNKRLYKKVNLNIFDQFNILFLLFLFIKYILFFIK